MKKKVVAKEYLLLLQRYRSVITLIACVVTFVATLYALGLDLVHYTREGIKIIDLFKYFTTLSNMLTALAASFIIPYAINGYRSRHFSYPKWVSMLHFAGTTCTTLVSLFTILFISSYNWEFAFGGSNFYLHVICPLMILISFIFVESHYVYSEKEFLICLLPFFLYSILYLVNVVVIGRWNDLYMLNTFVPFYVSLPGMYLAYFGIAHLIKWISLYVSKLQQERMFSPWPADTDPLNIKIDVYGMGIDKGTNSRDDDELNIPIGILEALGEKFSIDPKELIKIYSKGLLEGLRSSSGTEENTDISKKK